MPIAEDQSTKDCARCGGRAFYWQTAVIPGDPMAPPRSSRATPHQQPAWTCLTCGYIEPHERRTHVQPTVTRRLML
jgi:hypothetical protein